FSSPPASCPALPSFPTRRSSDLHVEGIEGVTSEMVETARDQGFVIKLLAVCERVASSPTGAGLSARVYPALIDRNHALASVRGAFNAVFIEAEAAGELMLYGQGAGGAPTASAALGDIVSVARRKVLGGRGQSDGPFHEDSRILPLSSITTRYHITLDVVERPGVLAAVSEVFADEGASIELMRQTVGDVDDDGVQHAKLVLATLSNTDSTLRKTV